MLVHLALYGGGIQKNYAKTANLTPGPSQMDFFNIYFTPPPPHGFSLVVPHIILNGIAIHLWPLPVYYSAYTTFKTQVAIYAIHRDKAQLCRVMWVFFKFILVTLSRLFEKIKSLNAIFCVLSYDKLHTGCMRNMTSQQNQLMPRNPAWERSAF